MGVADGTPASSATASTVEDLDKLERATAEGKNIDDLRALGYGSMLAESKEQSGAPSFVDANDRLFPAGERQSAALDMTRICCVFLVSVDHGGTRFGVWNTMYVQAWVLQYLFLICGICFGMSARPVWSYCQRLSLYFVIGVCCNWTAFVIKGLDWRNNMWNVVFQFWFIVGLMGFCLLLAPLRHYLRSVSERLELPRFSYGISFNLVAIAAGAVIVTLICRWLLTPLIQRLLSMPLMLWSRSLGEAGTFWGLPQTVLEANDFLQAFVSYLDLSIINIFIAVVWPRLSTWHSLTGWLMILNTYAHKMLLYRAQEARLLTGFDCTTIGLTCYYLGLSHRAVVGRYLVRYWFALLFACSLLWPPGTYGRFDEHPPTDLGTRVKDNLLEMIFMILFLCGMESMVDRKIFTEDRMEFLGWWALIVFLMHKAIHITTPAPLNWILIMGIAPVCWWCCRKTKPTPAEPMPVADLTDAAPPVADKLA